MVEPWQWTPSLDSIPMRPNNRTVRILEGQARRTGQQRCAVRARRYSIVVALGALVSLMMVLMGGAVASAAVTITVPCTGTASVDSAALAAAVLSADSGGGGTITLTKGCTYSFATPYANTGSQDLADWYGPAALPAIAASITIQGNGATIARSSGSPAFRLFFVGASPSAAATSGWTTPGAGSLTLENLTLSGGLAQGGDGGAGGGGGGLGAGGAIYSQGTVVLSAVTLSGNEALGGSVDASNTKDGGGGIGAEAPAASNDGGGFGAGFTAPAGAPAGGAGGTGVLTNDGGGGAGFATTETGTPAGALGAGAGGGSLTGTAGDAETSDGAKGGDGGGGGSGMAVLTAGGAGGAYGEGGTGAASGGAGGGGVGGGGGGATNGAGGGFGGGGGYPGGAGGFGAGGAGDSGAAGFGGGAGGTTAVGGGGAGMGGAIFNQEGTVVGVNTTLSANTAAGGSGGGSSAKAGSGFGGATFSLDGVVELINDTVAANTADLGGALYAVGYNANSAATQAVVALINDILSGSITAAQAATSDLVVEQPGTVADGTTVNKASAVASASAANIVVSKSATGTIDGTPLTANPLLGSLANNGGPGMDTMLPGSGSPALKAGTTTVALPTDERGTARPAAGPIDLGAVQVSVGATPPPPPPTPVVVDGAASSVTPSKATLNATVDPEGVATSYYFQYGTSAKYGSKTKTTSAGAGTSAVPVSATISKLTTGRTYHWRIVATNANGTSDGIGRIFSTVASISGLPVTTKPHDARAFPYRYTFSGKVRLPSGVTGKAGCSGKVTVRIERGKKTVSLQRAKVGSSCAWKASARLSNRKLVPGHGKLSVIVSFGGNAVLAPHTNKPFSILYG